MEGSHTVKKDILGLKELSDNKAKEKKKFSKYGIDWRLDNVLILKKEEKDSSIYR